MMRVFFAAILIAITSSAFADNSLRRCDRIERGKNGMVKRGDSITHAFDVLGSPNGNGRGLFYYRKKRKTIFIYHSGGQITDVCTEKN